MSKVCEKDVHVIQLGSQLLKECAVLLGIENKKFRDLLFSGKLRLSTLPPDKRQFVESAIPDIKAVKRIEGRVIRNLEGLIYKFASFAYKKTKSPVVDLEDFRQDARYAVSESLFGYNDSDKCKFITYVSRCIQNRLAKSINACNPMCPLTNEALALLRMVEETRASLNRPANLEEIFDILQLTKEQRSLVNDASVTVNEESYLNTQSLRFDYTEKRHGIDKEDAVYCFELRDAIKKANLTDIEKHVVEACMDDYYGWQEDVASKYINPRTGKRYSRASIPFILKRAFEKIQMAK